ncbi:MAG TPA: signal peptidase I, partial [Candidatus Saccharimonadales bacterium]
RVPASELQIGDVITYVNKPNKKRTIAHRVIAIQGAQLIVKGDANRSADTPISVSQVTGKVSYSIPRVGYAANFVRKPLGKMLLLTVGVYLPALLITISEIRRLSGYYRKSQPYISPQIAARLKNIKRTTKQKLAWAGKLTVFLAVISIAIALPVHALLTSTATLTGNTISAINPPGQCSGNNTDINISGTTVVVNNSNNQTATSGNVTGPNATSGDASNSNCTNIDIDITNSP